MNKIKYCILIIFLLGSTLKPNPIAVTYFSELYFTSTGWKLELHKNHSWEADTLLGLYLINSAGQKAFIKDSLILYENSYLVLTAENLDSPFEINKQKDTITLYWPNTEDNYDYYLDRLVIDLTDSIFSGADFSICFRYFSFSSFMYPYYDYSPTLGFENDTLDAYCTVSGIVKDSVGNVVSGARVIYNWKGIMGAEVIEYVVTDAEGRFTFKDYSGRRRILIDTISVDNQYSWPTLKSVEFHALPRQFVFLNIELPIISRKNEKNYFPLEVGNRWDFEVFEWDAGNYSHYDTLSVEVIKDTVMPNGIKYAVLNTIFLGVSEYVRTDPNGIYYYSPYFDSLDLFVFNFYVAPGHSYRIYPDQAFPTAELSYIDTVTIFNSKVNKYRYAFFDGIVGHSIIFADKFGPVEHHTAGDGTTLVIDSKLLGCRISGVVYGKLTSVDNSENSPVQYYLSQNYPNPFNPATTIRYSLPETEKVLIKVYDIIGREIATLVNEEKPAGEYKAEFNASNLSSGIYFYRVTAGEFVQIRKMILLR